MTGEVFTLLEVEKNRIWIIAQFKNPILLTMHVCAHKQNNKRNYAEMLTVLISG